MSGSELVERTVRFFFANKSFKILHEKKNLPHRNIGHIENHIEISNQILNDHYFSYLICVLFFELLDLIIECFDTFD